MPASPSTSEMGRRHVERAAEALGAVPSAGSGNRWQNPADGRSPHDAPYPVALEGKSTRGKSITVTLDMLAKLREQALGEHPVLPMCWYGTDDLTVVTEDWAAVPLDFLAELLASARAWVELETALGDVTRDQVGALVLKAGTVEGLRRSLADAHQALGRAEEALARRDIEVAALRDQASAQSTVLAAEGARHLPQLPWAVIRLFSRQEIEARSAAQQPPRAGVALDYAADGTLRTYTVSTVRIERTMGNRPKVMVDNVQVRDADVLSPDGVLKVRAWQGNQQAEVG